MCPRALRTCPTGTPHIQAGVVKVEVLGLHRPVGEAARVGEVDVAGPGVLAAPQEAPPAGGTRPRGPPGAMKIRFAKAPPWGPRTTLAARNCAGVGLQRLVRRTSGASRPGRGPPRRL